jgi:hypothetical protein
VASKNGNGTAIARWKRDAIAFVREVLVNPETGKPFELYPAQERFLREALTLKADGAAQKGWTAEALSADYRRADGGSRACLCAPQAWLWPAVESKKSLGLNATFLPPPGRRLCQARRAYFLPPAAAAVSILGAAGASLKRPLRGLQLNIV